MYKLYELIYFTAVKSMISMVVSRNFFQILHNFENSSKCLQMIQKTVVKWVAGVLLLVCISMWFFIFCSTFDFFPHPKHYGRFFMNSSILIFHFYFLSWILSGTQCNCASGFLCSSGLCWQENVSSQSSHITLSNTA